MFLEGATSVHMAMVEEDPEYQQLDLLINSGIIPPH
jgi:hypothetical protein